MVRAARSAGVVLEDGPVAGSYSLQRAPTFLRAVLGRDGRHDVLDQLSDRPLTTEAVYVYEATGPTWSAEAARLQGVIICPPPGASGHYRHRADVDGQQLRDTEAWRDWCRAQPVDRETYDPTTGKKVPALSPVNEGTMQ